MQSTKHVPREPVRAPGAGRSVEPWRVPAQPFALTLMKGLAVAVSTLLLGVLAARCAGELWEGASPWPALAGLTLGYLAADFLSGAAHWFCDTFFAEDTPLIGKTLIFPFRDHHRHPQRITQYGFLEQDTANFFLFSPFLASALWAGAPAEGSTVALVWTCGLVGLAGGSFCTNLFHKWAHQRHPPRAVRWLQAVGLVLSPERHQKHHRDYSLGFCVTSGWMNPILDALGFFPRLEKLLRFFRR